MAQIQQLAYGVNMQAAVVKGQAVSLKGFLANTGTTDQEPFGIAQLDANAGDRVAVTIVGVEDIKHDGTLAVGDYVKATAGICVVATTQSEAFALVGKVTGNRAEIILK